MSRGLGPKQIEALALLRDATDGILVARELASALGLSERRCHKLVDSLVERGGVETTRDRGGIIRAWGRQALRRAEFEAGYREFVLSRVGPITCPGCGVRIEPNKRGTR